MPKFGIYITTIYDNQIYNVETLDIGSKEILDNQMKVEDSFSDKQINSASRLAWLSLCQIVVICVVGVYHVIYLRRIFKDKIWTPF